MPKLGKHLPITFTFRRSPDDAKKLAMLAEATHRGQGEILRLLLRQAVVMDRPDIQVHGIPVHEASVSVQG